MGEVQKNPFMKWFVIHVIVIAALVAGLFAITKMPRESASDAGTMVYIVRHAEKITGENAGQDPALTPQGQVRARVLAEKLRNRNINYVYSSDYIRTRDTAAPSAKMAGVEIEIYDPRNLASLAEIIKNQSGRYLVVGHSNTIRETVVALEGNYTGSPVNEKSEYDRLYEVLLMTDGQTAVRLNHYGQRYISAQAEEE